MGLRMKGCWGIGIGIEVVVVGNESLIPGKKVKDFFRLGWVGIIL